MARTKEEILNFFWHKAPTVKKAALMAMESYHKEKLREGLIAYEKFLGMNEEDFMKSIDRFLNSR